MKRMIFTLTLGLLTAVTFASCRRMAYHLQSIDLKSSSTSSAQRGGTRTVGRLPHFDGVTVSNGITLKYVAEGTPSITVTTSNISPSDVMVHVDDDELKINYSSAIQVANEKTVVTITGYAIKDFELDNGGMIDIAQPLNVGGKLSFELNNGGTIKLVSAKASELDVEVNNGGTFQIGNVEVAKLEMDVNNGGNINVNGATVSESDAEVSNGGDIALVGTANVSKYQINNGGKIQAERLKSKRAAVEIYNGGTLHFNAQSVFKQAVMNGGQAQNHFK
ncbi:GIN domain-containing protein [Ihuprevotella massiliensis]|uniref:GIN domain-containing protein n=1 Tax=Ihuprevotella massiliensis TaxID=1852368 RepID=UPI0009F3F684